MGSSPGGPSGDIEEETDNSQSAEEAERHMPAISRSHAQLKRSRRASFTRRSQDSGLKTQGESRSSSWFETGGVASGCLDSGEISSGEGRRHSAEPSWQRKEQETGELLPYTCSAFLECSCSPRCLSLTICFPVFTPSPCLIHMAACLWSDLQFMPEPGVHLHELASSPSSGMPLYPSTLLFDPRILCRVAISPIVFPLPPLHICRAAAAAAVLAEQAAVSSAAGFDSLEGCSMASDAAELSEAGGSGDTVGISPGAPSAVGLSKSFRVKVAALRAAVQLIEKATALGTVAAGAVKTGASRFRSGVLWRAGEFRGICPCVPVSQRQALGQKIAVMRELHWMKRPLEERKLHFRVSQLVLVLPSAAACTTQQHSLEMRAEPGFRGVWGSSGVGSLPVPPGAGGGNRFIDAAVTRLLKSCRYCCICQQETCCCRADPVRLLLQPPDLKLPCLWLCCGDLDVMSTPASASEPGKIGLRITDIHIAAFAKLRNSLSLLQTSEVRGPTLTPLQGKTTGDALREHLGSRRETNRQGAAGNPLEPAEDSRPGTIEQAAPQRIPQRYRPPVLRDFSRLGKLRRSLGARTVLNEDSGAHLIFSCHHVLGQVVHRPAHSLFARADGVMRYGLPFLGVAFSLQPLSGTCHSPQWWR